MHCSQHTLLAEVWLFDGTEDLDTDSAGTTALAAHFFSTVPPPPAPFLPPESSTLSAHSLICNKNKVNSSRQQKKKIEPSSHLNSHLPDPHLIQFQFIQVSQESVHSFLSHHFHGSPQSFKSSITDLWGRVIYLL